MLRDALDWVFRKIALFSVTFMLSLRLTTPVIRVATGTINRAPIPIRLSGVGPDEATAFEENNMRFPARLMRDCSGASAIELALVIVLISLGIVTAVSGIGDEVSATFNATSSTMASVA